MDRGLRDRRRDLRLRGRRAGPLACEPRRPRLVPLRDALRRPPRAPAASGGTNGDESRRAGGLVGDFLSAIPFALLFGPTPFQLLRLLKLARVAQLLGEWRSREIRHAAALRLVFFVYWFVLLTHVVACCWVALRGPEGSPGGGSRYVSALYWAVTTLATVGYGDVTPSDDAQRIFAVVVMLLGVGT